MPRICHFCGKGPMFGHSVARRGLAKKKGGVGKKVTGISKRKYKPNLQRIRAVINGKTQRVYVCTKCIHMGKVQKPARSATA